jgi:hypothetical protein
MPSGVYQVFARQGNRPRVRPVDSQGARRQRAPAERFTNVASIDALGTLLTLYESK